MFIQAVMQVLYYFKEGLLKYFHFLNLFESQLSHHNLILKTHFPCSSKRLEFSCCCNETLNCNFKPHTFLQYYPLRRCEKIRTFSHDLVLVNDVVSGKIFCFTYNFSWNFRDIYFFKWLRYVVFVAREAPKAEYEAYLNTF